MSLMAVADILRDYRDGDERGWDREFAWLKANHGADLHDLAVNVLCNGFLEPVTLGGDGRVWDGHHRLCVAVDYGIRDMPVTFAGEAL